jgi:hypothetical protein
LQYQLIGRGGAAGRKALRKLAPARARHTRLPPSALAHSLSLSHAHTHSPCSLTLLRRGS